MLRRLLTVAALIVGVMGLSPTPASAIAPACPTLAGSCTPCLAGTATTSFAPCAQPVSNRLSEYPTYKGWARVDPNYCPPGRACITLFRTTAIAWYWSGTTWVRRSRPSNSHVYAWPYTTGWTWTWTANTGWLAMRSGELERYPLI